MYVVAVVVVVVVVERFHRMVIVVGSGAKKVCMKRDLGDMIVDKLMSETWYWLIEMRCPVRVSRVLITVHTRPATTPIIYNIYMSFTAPHLFVTYTRIRKQASAFL